jgi:hypothetical protein
VTNCTNAKLVVSLVVPSWCDPLSSTGGSKQQVFTAFPESLELRPQASGTFRLAFRPPRDGQYHCQVRPGRDCYNKHGWFMLWFPIGLPPCDMGFLAQLKYCPGS